MMLQPGEMLCSHSAMTNAALLQLPCLCQAGQAQFQAGSDSYQARMEVGNQAGGICPHSPHDLSSRSGLEEPGLVKGVPPHPEGWNGMSFKDPSNPNQAGIL